MHQRLASHEFVRQALELFENYDPAADKTWLVRQTVTLLSLYRSAHEALIAAQTVVEKTISMTFLMMVSRERLSEVLKDRASMRGLIQLPPMQVRSGARQPQLRLLCFPLYLHRRQLPQASHRRSVSQYLAQPLPQDFH